MTLSELYNLLKTTGYPVIYSHFDKPTKPPFITYLETSSTNFFADGKVHKKISNVQIELYTVKKDIVAENKIEDVLDDNNIPYESSETFIDSEKLFQKIYEVRLL